MTICLKNKNVEGATTYKAYLEQRQREDAKARKEKGINWRTKVKEKIVKEKIHVNTQAPS